VYRTKNRSKESFFKDRRLHGTKNIICKTVFVFICFPVFLILTEGCAGARPASRSGARKAEEQKLLIRVAVGEAAGVLNLVSERLELVKSSGNEALPASVELVAGEEGVTIGGVTYATPLHIRGGTAIAVNGKEYYGDLLIEDGLLINILPLDEYLKGVLSGEVSESWPIEALKAQAVASRTFAIKRMSGLKDGPYHVKDTLMHQKYEYSTHNENINRAVEATSGEILLFRGEPIEAFFHSCSGGITENAGSVFQQDLPYLKSVPDPYCRNNDQFDWRFEASAESIVKALGSSLDEVDPSNSDSPGRLLRDIRIYRRTGSGRAGEFVLYLDGGKKVTVKGNRFRLALDSTKLKSLLIRKIEKRRGDDGLVFVFSGTGYGHGVGMSQWGAKMMADHGFRYQDILSFYYRGTKIGVFEGTR
jgi:stage II sporulation protein D